MKLPYSCPICPPSQPKPVAVHLRDDGTADVNCAFNHRFFVISPHDKYEILFDSGALALLDDYPREALANFAAALEQFQGYFVRVLSRHLFYHAGDGELPSDEVWATWKQVAKQSERQVGAFLFLHLVATGKAYTLPKRLTELRNRVVHAGYFPTTDEASDYGRQVWEAIHSLLWYLIHNCQSALFHEDAYRRSRIEAPAGVPVVETLHSFMLSEAAPVENDGFSARLFQLRTQWRWPVYGRGPEREDRDPSDAS